MGSPISLSGFNNIDFNLILNTIMAQERIPVTTLENDRRELQGQDGEYSALAKRLADFETALEKLATTDAFAARAVTNTDTTAVSASVSDTTPIGTYDVVVTELARAQVMASSSTHADSDTTIVASGGTLTIGGIVVTVSSNVTLDELSALINSTTDIPVTASVISSGATSYQLVLTGNDTGATNAYTLTNALTGGTSAVTFADFDSDGTSGDDASDNAVSATDGAATVNNISVTSSTNKITGAVPGATITLLTKDAATTVTLTVTRDDSEVKELVDGFVDVYNELSDYLDQQFALAADGSATAIGRDGLLRGLRTALRQTVTQSYSVGGTYSYLAEVGIGSNAAGELTFDKTMFDDALETSLADVESLFLGAGGTNGAFVTLEALVQTYTETNGLLPGVRERLDDQVLAIDDRVQILEERLASRRASLEREFIAADLAIAQLNNQLASLSSLGQEYRLF